MRIYQSLDPICGLLAHPWTVLTGYGSGNIINAVWAGAKHTERLLNGLGMNGSAAVGFAAGISNHSGRQCSTVQFLSLAALELPYANEICFVA